MKYVLSETHTAEEPGDLYNINKLLHLIPEKMFLMRWRCIHQNESNILGSKADTESSCLEIFQDKKSEGSLKSVREHQKKTTFVTLSGFWPLRGWGFE